MDNVLIVFASITSANRAKYMLMNQYGIISYVIQTPKNLSVGGCSYCLRLDRINLDTAWRLVQSMGVSIKGAYSESTFSKIL